MSFWNYRIIHNQEDGESYCGLYEVFYDDDGTPWGRTEEPIAFVGEEPDDILNALGMALRDVQDKPVLTDDDFKDNDG